MYGNYDSLFIILKRLPDQVKRVNYVTLAVILFSAFMKF